MSSSYSPSHSPSKRPPILRKTPATSPRHSLAVGGGLSGGRAGVCCTFRVLCKDAEGVKRTLGGDVVSAMLSYDDGFPPMEAHVMDNTDGTYTLAYTPMHASSACKLDVLINGTHVQGSPFSPQVTAGEMETSNTEIFGRGLYDGQSGRPAMFTIQTKDSFGNRCSTPGIKFLVKVTLSKSLVPEFEAHLKHYEPLVEVMDAGDGTYTCTFTPAQAGFYSIQVTRDSVPVGRSPYRTCIFNDSIAFPPTVVFYELHGQTTTPLPQRPARDYILLDGKIHLIESDPPPSKQRHRQREWLHMIELTHLPNEKWKTMPIRSTGMTANPPSARATCAVDDLIVLLCHGGRAGEISGGSRPIDEVRVLDLSDMDQGAPNWRLLPTEGKPPNAVGGYATAVWEGRNSVLVSGGVDAEGKFLTDLWLLQLSVDAPCAWRSLIEWPSSIFEGEGPSARCGHSLTFLPPSKFYVFGGVDEEGNYPNGLSCFDMDSSSWSRPVERGAIPAGRTGHGTCFIAERYLVIYGGTDSVGDVIETASVYDLMTSTWTTVLGIAPRTDAKLVSRGGIMYLMGGTDRKGNAAPAVPLCSECFPFAQKGALEFVGSKEQAVICKPGARLQPAYAVGDAQKAQAMRSRFTVEAAFMCRSFQGNGSFSPAPLILKSDAGLKTGFGLFIQEHPCFKGDSFEGHYVHFWFGAYSVTNSEHVKCKIELDKWWHVAGTYDGQALKIYLNGTLRETFMLIVEGNEGESHSKGDVYIGGMSGKYAFDGYIDHVRVWNDALDEEGLRAVLNEISLEPKEALAAQWTFNEGSGENILDSAQEIPRLASYGTFDRYAGGVELRRVQSTRPYLSFLKTAREELIDAQFTQLREFKDDFEEREGRKIQNADVLLAPPEILNLARRLGVLDASSTFFQDA